MEKDQPTLGMERDEPNGCCLQSDTDHTGPSPPSDSENGVLKKAMFSEISTGKLSMDIFSGFDVLAALLQPD